MEIYQVKQRKDGVKYIIIPKKSKIQNLEFVSINKVQEVKK